MKKTKLIILAGVMLAVASCSKKSSSTTTPTSGDSTFNGSYLQLTINGKSYYEKDVTVKNVGHIVILTAENKTITLISGGTTSAVSISLTDKFGTYGLISATMTTIGSGIGTYHFTSSALSSVIQASPSTGYDDTTGTMNVTYNGSDYVQGTINTTLYTGGFTYPTTGSFKIYK